MPTPHYPPAAVRRTLRKLGGDIRDARRRRHLPMEVVADRAFTSRSTLQRVEAGDTNVGIGIYAAVLQALGLHEGWATLQILAEIESAKSSRLRNCRPGCASGVRRTRMTIAEINVDPGLRGYRATNYRSPRLVPGIAES